MTKFNSKFPRTVTELSTDNTRTFPWTRDPPSSARSVQTFQSGTGLSFLSKKLLKDSVQLQIHAKVGRFSNVVTPRTNFTERRMPQHQQKVRSMLKISGPECMECTLVVWIKHCCWVFQKKGILLLGCRLVFEISQETSTQESPSSDILHYQHQ